MEKLKNLFWIFFSAVILCSCSQEEDSAPQSQSFLKFKAGGKLVEYSGSNQPMGFSLDASGPMYLATAIILGTPGDGTKNFLSITVRNETTFQLGKEYQMQQAFQYKGANLVRILLTYSDASGQVFNAVLFQQNIPGMKVTDDAQLKFTKITSDWVEGTFSGVLLGPVSSLTGRGNTELVITEGQFSLPLINNIP